MPFALSDISWKISAKKVSKAWSILLIFKYATYKTMFWDLESIMQMLKYLSKTNGKADILQNSLPELAWNRRSPQVRRSSACHLSRNLNWPLEKATKPSEPVQICSIGHKIQSNSIKFWIRFKFLMNSSKFNQAQWLNG